MEAMETIAQDGFGGVLETVWAEGEEGGGIDLGDGGDLDLGENGGGEDGTEGGQEGGEEGGEGGQGTEEPKVDLRRGSKEFREWLKQQEATPEGAKFAKQARADHFRAQEIAAIEPGGVSAIRETYALLESIGGPEALTTMQERIAEADGVDQALAAGDPKALEGLGPEFDAGLAKLTPNILERIMRSDPEAYAAAILPHLMSSLSGSPLVQDLNRMIDVLGPESHLDDAGKLKAITNLLGRIGAWYDANEKKAAGLKTAPVDKGRQELETERTKFEEQQQQAHWKNNIIPAVAQAERSKFDELLKPYAMRLKLSPAQKEAALKDFRSKLSAALKDDKEYQKQISLYRKQKNPNPAQVQNFAKANLAKRAQAAFNQVKDERWGTFLTGKPGGQKPAVQPGSRQPAPNGGTGTVTIVSVKPSPDDIDYRKTSEADQWNKVYTLKNGKRVKWVKPA